jgi:DNA repair exonuclease SbcCD ATPase subunit
MFKIFEKWAEQGRKQAYENGFAWVCIEYLHKQVALSDLRSKISPEFFTEFDRGAADALSLLDHNKTALEASYHNFQAAKKEVTETRQCAQTLHKANHDLALINDQLRAEIGQYRTALASIQTKCKIVLTPLPNLVHEPEYSINDEYNQERGEGDDSTS